MCAIRPRPNSLFFHGLMILLCCNSSCGLMNPTDTLEFQPSQVPVGPLALGVWLPAGLDRFRFEAEDQERLVALGINQIEWLQRANQDSLSAEELAMAFCNHYGMRMPVYYEPRGYSPYDKLRNWATRTELEAGFADSVRERVQGLQQQWSEATGFYGYLVGHEDYRKEYAAALGQIVEVLRQEDPSRPALTVGNIGDYASVEAFMDAFFAAGGPANIFQHERYVFRKNVPLSGKGLQRRLQDLVRGYESVARHLQGRHGRWHAIVQAQGEIRQGEVFYRQPSAAELRVQAGLALSQGASGIIYFLYSSGVEEVLDRDSVLVERREYLGLVDRDGVPTPSYFAVQQLNGWLHRLSEVLEELHFHGGFSNSKTPRNPLLRNAAVDLAFGLFGDGVNASHLLVVNRRTGADREVELEVYGEQVTDALSGEKMEVLDGKFQVRLEAGGFRLLKTAPRSATE